MRGVSHECKEKGHVVLSRAGENLRLSIGASRITVKLNTICKTVHYSVQIQVKSEKKRDTKRTHKGLFES